MAVAPFGSTFTVTRREGVDLFRIEDRSSGSRGTPADRALPAAIEQLAQPLEMLLVALGADAAFLVFPVRGNAFFREPMHLVGANLHLERETAIANHRGVQRLIAVGRGMAMKSLMRPGTGDHVWWMMPSAP